MLADLALESGVSSYVFSSAERGGESHDDNAVLDRLAKINIEKHIRELGNKGLPWTYGGLSGVVLFFSRTHRRVS